LIADTILFVNRIRSLLTFPRTHKLLKDVDPVSGRKTLNDYELFEKLGSGQHGTVKLGRHLTNQQTVAVKIVRRFSKRVRLGKHGDPSDMIKKEVAILKKARHPHVVSLLEVIDDDEHGKVYLVLEYVARGEIVWRKKTDKAVATFEMKRIKREKASGINETFEHEEVEHFNQGAPARRFEKARNLERHKSKSQARPDAEVAGPYWSLEYGEENEEIPSGGKEVGPGVSTGATSFVPLQADSSLDAHGISPQSSTPKQLYTPKPAPFDAMVLETVTPDSLSRQESTKAVSELRLEDPSADLQGTMYGPYVPEEPILDVPLRWRLQDFIDEQTQWTEEEEEYMYVPCLTIEQTQTAFRQTVLGLEYLHFQGIIHRDIKPANLLWTDNFEVKISDFGVSYLGKPLRRGDNNEELSEADAADKMEAVELAKTVGTPAFYAPELCDPDLFDFEKNPERPRITGQIDVWALGVTLYCMIFGRLPFVDSNEMGMYEKIAREEVFIPRVRLRGVENSDKDPETNYKRLDDILEYEAVDDELRDLIERLLDKDPTKRISIKEVKHHPWVLRGISDQDIWVDETDPSVQSQGKRIEISNEDVASAVVPLTLVDRVKAGLRRLGSVVRGREGRKRTDSNVKTPDSPSSTALKGSSSGQEGRRPSLRGDEQIFTALRASREGSEHPLSQSVAASPETKTHASYFDSATEATTDSSNNSPRASRPTMSERTLSSADSARTVKAAVPAIQESIVSPGELFTSLTTSIDTSSSSSLGGIFHGAGRRFVHSMRSRERGRDQDSPSRSSRSSSADTSASIIDDPHASPSLAISSAIAAGHVDQPPILREGPSPADLYRAAPSSSPTPSRSQVESPSEAFQKSQEQNLRRQIVEVTRDGPTDVEVPSGSPETPCPASPDDDLFYDQQNRATPVGVSSSSDQMASGISESFSYPSVPSVVSGASSFSATIDTYGHLPLSKETLPSTLVPRNVSESSDEPVLAVGNHPRAAKASGADEDEAGYNGEGEMDSDSDEDLLMMGPKK
jgi:serine/threonine protein kinase